ncbi:MAG: penicillin-insensitive murein endopeptidase [Myxococcales bacterium]|nr:penicillin-insensitive murein endopeptidase [Myxococcales bacterium]MCB9754722.1 penicillin-insensitive murein endopeptidase [Myxococcales bacterium]
MQVLTLLAALLAAGAMEAEDADERPPPEEDVEDLDGDDEARSSAFSGGVEREGARARWFRHTVVKRETVEQLALRYRVKASSLREWNKLGALTQPEEGDRLRVFSAITTPPREPVEYTLREGDTWVSIARPFGANPADVRRYNYLRVRRNLDPGEVVVVWSDPTIRDAITRDAPPPGPAAEIRPGAYSYGFPHRGELVNGVRVPESDAYVLRYPNSAWGSTYAVRAAVTALHGFRARAGYGGLVRLGTMSRQRGGKVGGHRSHQSGRDLDVRLPLRAELDQQLQPSKRRVDWLATWHLIDAFLQTGAVKVIFFDYRRQKLIYRAARDAGVDEATLDEVLQWPIGKGELDGRVRHSSGHTGHIHVRFRCAPYETECVDL